MDSNPVSSQHLKLLEPVLAGIVAEFRQFATRNNGKGPEPESYQTFELSFRQIEGALEMVGDKAGARFAEALRELCEALARSEIKATERTLAVARHASQTLEGWFQGLAVGEAGQIRTLRDDFVQLRQCMGKQPDLRELFFPDLCVRPLMPTRKTVLWGGLIPEFYQHQYMRYQKALGELGRNAEEALKALQRSLTTVERVQTDSDEWVYWWLGKAVADAAVDGGVEPSPVLTSVFERLGERLKQAASETTAPDEGLLRDSLFLLAQSQPVTKEIGEIHRLYALDTGFASFDGLEPPAEDLTNILRDAAVAIESAKAAWLEFGRKDPGWYPRFNAGLSKLKLVAVGDAGFKSLVQWLIDCALDLYLNETACDDDLDLEMASALLILENALAHGHPPATLGEGQFEIVRRRLELVLSPAGQDAHGAAAGHAPQVELDAREQEVFRLVSHEVLLNLREAERELDWFFRNPEQRSALPGLDRILSQAEGAIAVLGLDRSAQLTRSIRLLVREFASAAQAPAPGDTDLLAENLSALTYFFQELQTGAAADQEWFGTLLERLQSTRPDIAERAARPEPLNVEEVAQTPAAAPSEAPGEASAPAPKESARPPQASKVEAPPPRPVAAIPEKPEKSEPVAPRKVVDPELLEVYLCEAQEILAALPEQLDACRVAPDNRDSLAAVRRAFHTLKGSGRMVGLMELGEAAWAVERALNHWLESSRSVTPALLEVLEEALGSTRYWVGQLAETGQVVVDYAALEAKARALEPSPVAASPSPEISETMAPLSRPEPGAGAEVPKKTVAAPPAKPPLKPERATSFVALAAMSDNPLLGVFIEEAQELFPQVGEAIRAWRENPTDLAHARSMLRVLHTLKGSSRLAGASRLGECVHQMETEIGEYNVHGKTPPPDWFDNLEGHMDVVLEEFDQLALGPDGRAELEGAEPENHAAPGVAEAPEQEGAIQTRQAISSVRVRADQLEYFALQSGEVSIARIRMETELRHLRRSLKQLSETTGIMRDQLRELAIQAERQMQSRRFEASTEEERFDPLEFDRFTRLQELTRMLAESAHDVVLVQQELNKNLARAERVVASQTRVTRDLQERVTQIRLVAFSRVADRFHRLVRQESRGLNKRAEARIHGGHVELDVGFLDRIVPPLEHLLRNAVAHGLELPQQRAAVGKSEVGVVDLQLIQESTGLVIKIKDDGAGIDFAKVKARAAALGLIGDEDVSQERLAQFLFAPGFTTSARVSDVAGRGVGLDVVRNEVQALGGRIELETRPGQGTTFTLHVPAKQAMSRVVPVRAGARLYALPTSMVQYVGKFDVSILEEAAKAGEIKWGGKDYRFFELQRLVGDVDSRPAPATKFWLVFLGGAQGRIAVVVDELLSTQEVVVKDPGPQVGRLKGMKGATVLSGGQLVLIIDPVELAFKEEVRVSSAQAAPAYASVPLLMVVDDSITVRTVTERFLARQGFQVVTAKDGIDALEQMQRITPDLLLVDIEMPRMDGFDLSENVRNNRHLAHIPIIMISSRTADKHRQQAFEIGVNAFLGKPYQDAELLGEINGLLGSNKERAVAY
jgi:chemosensory pili system protein ChpA (sensor histidine kinase/response regulator)